MYHYRICPDVNANMFYEECNRLEKNFPGMRKEKLRHGFFDNTLIQEYQCSQGRIIVKNDELVGALYIDSDIDLGTYGAQLEKTWLTMKAIPGGGFRYIKNEK